MRNSLILASTVVLFSVAGCKKTAPATTTTSPAPMGSGETCTEARPLTMGATAQGDLTTARDDFNSRVELTGYSWQGRDHFYYADLASGQTVTLRLDDGARFDGGLYVFRDCNNVLGTVVAGKDTNPTTPLTFTAPAAGRYLIAVDSWQPNTGAAYSLTMAPGST